MIKILITFLAITGAATHLMNFTNVQFGVENYWDNRGMFFLFFITIFPRLTLLFSSVAFGGLFWWLSFLFAPRVLVAVLATTAYWEQNPILVVIAWLMAVGGESSEKAVVRNRYDVVKKGGNVFEAEFKRL